MSTLLERPKSRASAGTALSGGLPQVNLLPPEVRAARGLKATKRWLVIGLGLTVVSCVGAFGLALVSGATAQSELAQAQEDMSVLQAEQAKYAEVPLVLGALSTTEAARTLGMSTEVQWKSYIDAITAVLPPGVSIESLTVTQATPMTAAGVPTDPLQEPSMGQILFTGRSVVTPDTAAWIDALNSVPGFADAWTSTITVTENEESGIYYTVSSSVQLTDAALSHRFDAPQGAGS